VLAIDNAEHVDPWTLDVVEKLMGAAKGSVATIIAAQDEARAFGPKAPCGEFVRRMARKRLAAANEALGVRGFRMGRRFAEAPPIFIAALRKKIEKRARHPRHLVTVHGIGYRLLLA
jgi:hypothetical protein